MPRISMWRENHGSDYKFIDRRISEMFTIGGTGILVHKFLGADTSGNDGSDATKPAYTSQSIFNIQDLLFVENRDRKYDSDVFLMRGIYQRADQDFSLSQFGIFLAEGTMFMTFHLNDCLEVLGRKLIPGDVLELQHLKDLWGLDDSMPVALKRYYVVQEAAFAAEGFSPTWWPHLWRVKLQPLVDSQEYKDILNKIKATPDDPFDPNYANAAPIVDYISTYNKYKGLNEAIIAQAEINLPKSGYDTTHLYTQPVTDAQTLVTPVGDDITGNLNIDGSLEFRHYARDTWVDSPIITVANSTTILIGASVKTANLGPDTNVTVVGKPSPTTIRLSANTSIAAGETITLVSNTSTPVTADSAPFTSPAKIRGYLVGDGTGPNGITVRSGIEFPTAAKSGDYFLRLDYVPNRLFRFSGIRWIKVEDVERTNLTPGASDNLTYRNKYVGNHDTFTDISGNVHPQRQSLSKALTPKADN